MSIEMISCGQVNKKRNSPSSMYLPVFVAMPSKPFSLLNWERKELVGILAKISYLSLMSEGRSEGFTDPSFINFFSNLYSSVSCVNRKGVGVSAILAGPVPLVP